MHEKTLEELVLKYANAKPYMVSNITIKFEYEGENELQAYISTPRLELESTSKKHANLYSQMTSNPKTMALYGTGKPWSVEYSNRRVFGWGKYWKQDNPFSGFAVYTHENENFVGHVALDYDETTPRSCAEISYIIRPESWGSGLGSEAVYTLVNPYAEALQNRYKCQGEPFKGVYATVRPDNLASAAVLLKSGLQLQEQNFKPKQTKWGDRLAFFKNLSSDHVYDAVASEHSFLRNY